MQSNAKAEQHRQTRISYSKSTYARGQKLADLRELRNDAKTMNVESLYSAQVPLLITKGMME